MLGDDSTEPFNTPIKNEHFDITQWSPYIIMSILRIISNYLANNLATNLSPDQQVLLGCAISNFLKQDSLVQTKEGKEGKEGLTADQTKYNLDRFGNGYTATAIGSLIKYIEKSQRRQLTHEEIESIIKDYMRSLILSDEN